MTTTTEDTASMSTSETTISSTESTTPSSTKTSTTATTSTTESSSTTTASTTATTATSTDCYCGKVNRFTRIVNGVETEENEYPWQAALVPRGSNSTFCGGSLINNRWVLTAAHCTPQGSPMDVLLGEHDNTVDSSTEVRKQVIQIIDHPNFSGITLDHDYSLLKLDSNVEFNTHIRPVCLPASNTAYSPSALMTVTGWGTTSFIGNTF